MIYLVEVTGAAAGGATTVFRYSTKGYVTLPTDTPANTYWEERVKTPGLLRQSMFSSGRTSGESEVGYGVIELVNNDGALDHLIDYAFDGWPLKIYTLEDENAPFSSAVVRFSGTMEQAEFDDTLMVLRVRDLMQSLDKPIQTVTYAGTNVGASGLEGSSDSLKGKVKPLTFGTVFNVAPAQANTTALIYQVNDGPISTCNVFDRGIALTKGTDYTSVTDMTGNVPAAGTYRVYPAGGYFRLGSTPSGMVTADVTQNATPSTGTTAQVVKAIVSRGTAEGFYPVHEYTVQSSGLGGNGSFMKDSNGMPVATVGRSYTLVVFANTGAVESANVYDVYGSVDAAAAFSSAVNALPLGTRALVFTYDEPQTNLPSIRSALLSLGASGSRLDTMVYRGAYILHGVKGSPEGLAPYEMVGNVGSGTISHTLSVSSSVMEFSGGVPIHEPDIAALNAVNSAPVGIYINSETTVLQAISNLTNSIGAYCMFDNESRLRLGRLELPSGTPDHTLDDWEILDISRIVSSDTERGIPAYKVTVKYGRNYVVQTMTDIAAAAQVQSERRGIDYRNASNQDDSVKLQYPLSEELVRETLLVNEADAQAEASRLLNIYKTRRDFFEVTCRTDKQIEIGQTVHVTYPRFLLNNGKLLRVLAVEPDYTLNRNILTLWG